MSILTNVISPIAQTVFYIGMVGWTAYLVYWVTKKLFPNFRWVLKYKILRNKYKDKDVEWCQDAVEKDLKSIEVKKFLLLKGLRSSKVSEMMFIYSQVLKEMKGGIKYDRQLEDSDGQIEKINSSITSEREIKN